MDKNYWTEYYKNARFAANPSPFAIWFEENYAIDGTLLELGCGNGRDALYFGQQGIDVIAYDQCENAIEQLNALGSSVEFRAGDFTALADTVNCDNIYSRFTLHSVDKESANRTIAWAGRVIGNGYFAIEVRSVLDPLCGQGTEVGEDTWFTDHSRRFVRKDQLVSELEKNGFQIVFEQESTGLAPYKDEDPVVIRIVAQKA